MSFFIFGLINNVLYVVILSAAIDLVGSATPKGVVLLADIMPSLLLKVLAPLGIHKIPYRSRLWALVLLSVPGMLLISFGSKTRSTVILGICMASASSGIGEVSFLLLTHYYPRKYSIGGFSTGTGGAGIVGSFVFMMLTNVFNLTPSNALLLFSVTPFFHICAYYFCLPKAMPVFSTLPYDDSHMSMEVYEQATEVRPKFDSKAEHLLAHITKTSRNMTPLILPYMVPLCSVYIFEYVINQAISPTLLFPLDDLPGWLFKEFRDIYVFYGFLYQVGVFLSRSSTMVGIRIRQLYILTFLQFGNVVFTLSQSIYGVPFSSIWLLSMLIFYEGLLGGFLYVNTFMSVSEQVAEEHREFALGCVGISDSFGIMVAGCISIWLEKELCDHQVLEGRNWCRVELGS